MTKIFETVKKKLQVWHEQRAQKLEAARQARLDAEARRVVQVMEFNGHLYVSVHGTPLFSDEDLDGMSLTGLVKEGRDNYKDWKEEKLWESGATAGSIRF